MTTLVSIMLYLAAAIFFGTFGDNAAKGADTQKQATLLVFFCVFFAMAAGLQVFG